MSRVPMQFTTGATHLLDSQGQALSAGSNCSSPPKLLTNWRANDSHCQQGPFAAHHQSNSLSGEPRTGIVNRFQMQPTTEATHFLDRTGFVSSFQIQLTTKATHPLESQGQPS